MIRVLYEEDETSRELLLDGKLSLRELLLDTCKFSCPCGSCLGVCLIAYFSSFDRFSLDVETSVSLPLKLCGKLPVII